MQARSLIVPGGEIRRIDRPVVMDTFRQPDDRKTIYSEDADCMSI